jgi:hypothetical protein
MHCRDCVLLLGDLAHGDFREARQWLRRHTQLSEATRLEDALGNLSRGNHHDAIVVAQSRPSQFSARDIERLHGASPLSRLVALLGSWCEGEMRTGRPWPGVMRVLWHQWRPRLIPHFQAAAGAFPGTWNLPRTASVTDQLAVTTEAAWPRRHGLIAIHARTFRDYRGLADACSQAGYSTVWSSPVQPLHASGFGAVLFDGIAVDDATAARIRHVVRQVQPAPVITLLDYVRRQDYERAVAAGSGAVIAKPLLTYDLLWHLDDLIRRPHPKKAAAGAHQSLSAPTSAA